MTPGSTFVVFAGQSFVTLLITWWTIASTTLAITSMFPTISPLFAFQVARVDFSARDFFLSGSTFAFFDDHLKAGTAGSTVAPFNADMVPAC